MAAKHDVARRQRLAIEALVGIAILSDCAAVHGDTGKEAARTGVTQNLCAKLQVC